MLHRHLLAPGPVPVPEDARLAMARSLIHHRGAEFTEILGRVQEGLAWIFGTEQTVLSLTCSGTGAFEAAMLNFSSPGETIISIGGGKFGERWGEMGRALGLEVVDLEVEWGEAVDPSELDALLEAHPEARMVTLSASETSTGVYHPMEEIAKVVGAHDEALLAVDGITAVGVHPLPMDELGIDVLVAGSQKAFAVPPGMGFVAAGPRAWQRCAVSEHRTYYFDLERELARQEGAQTAFTPAISVVLALDEVLRRMRDEGLQNLYRRQATLGRACRAAVAALGLDLFATRPADGVTAVRLPDALSAPSIRARMRDVYGVTIAGGQKHLADHLLRIGHMGQVDASNLLVGLGALERALTDEGYDFEPGTAVAAAQRVFTGAESNHTE